MPFTLAHPAAVLPWRRRLGRWGCASALAVGAMAPDLPHFVPLGVTGATSHSLTGLLWFCVPVGIAGWLAYEHLVRAVLVAIAPRSLQCRLREPKQPDLSAQGWAAAVVSVFVGAATHVAWDSFTHGSGLAVQAFPSLRAPVALLPGYHPPIFTLLQHGSTLVGLSVLAWMAARWYRRTPASESPTWRPVAAWVRVLTASALMLPAAFAGGFVLWSRMSSAAAVHPTIQRTVVHSVVASGGVFLAALALTALAWRLAALPRAAGDGGSRREDARVAPQGDGSRGGIPVPGATALQAPADFP